MRPDAASDSTPPALPPVTPRASFTPQPLTVKRGSLPLPPDYILYIHDPQSWPRRYELRAIAPDGTDDRLVLDAHELTNAVPSPGGRYLAVSHYKPSIVDLESGAVTLLDSHEESAGAGFHWLSDEILYYIWYDPDAPRGWSLWRIETATAPELELVMQFPERSFLLHLWDDSRLVLSEPNADETYGQIVLFNWRTGERAIMSADYVMNAISLDRTRVVLYARSSQYDLAIFAFQIANVNWETGTYTGSILVNPIDGARFYDFPHTFSPDGQHIIGAQSRTGELWDNELVVITYGETTYDGRILRSTPGHFCGHNPVWYGSSQVIASCAIGPPDRTQDHMPVPYELWLLPIDGSPGIRLLDGPFYRAIGPVSSLP